MCFYLTVQTCKSLRLRCVPFRTKRFYVFHSFELSWFYDSFIVAFDRHRFYAPDELYSEGIVKDCKPLAFKKVEEGTILKQEHIDEWDRIDWFFTWYYADILGKNPFSRWWG